ncbi:putative rna-directed dna polymerase from transposon bs [Trichonephila clavata]|uniref:Putative rna-directed dna polymerase from transposon bs n=1 Tax=Trichonephila clavata TaxID=2740835 RepID=A0A8X6KUM1_TRICU|nr:putative rna-directed dna polymerase from transposon bs [Trichonephila clavata]
MGALKLIERLKRHVDFWRNYNPAERRQSLLETGEFIRHLIPACYNLDLVLPVNKRSCINTELRLAALATIGERFPETHWLHVYTDGSAAGANHNAGAGGLLQVLQGSWCKLYYDGEVAVVHIALTEVGKREDRNIAIFIDSQAAILAVSSVPSLRNGLVLDCQSMINSLINNSRNVTLQWVPSHCGVIGNELADALAIAGSALSQSDSPLGYHSVKKIIASRFRFERLSRTLRMERVGVP